MFRLLRSMVANFNKSDHSKKYQPKIRIVKKCKFLILKCSEISKKCTKNLDHFIIYIHSLNIYEMLDLRYYEHMVRPDALKLNCVVVDCMKNLHCPTSD